MRQVLSPSGDRALVLRIENKAALGLGGGPRKAPLPHPIQPPPVADRKPAVGVDRSELRRQLARRGIALSARLPFGYQDGSALQAPGRHFGSRRPSQTGKSLESCNNPSRSLCLHPSVRWRFYQDDGDVVTSSGLIGSDD